MKPLLQNQRGIEIGMLGQTTPGAHERRLRDSVLFGDVAAPVACLRGIGGWHFRKCPARPREFVAQTFNEFAPSRVKNAASKPAVRADHVTDMEFLNDDRAVTLGIGSAESMDEVLALPPHLAVNASDAALRLFSIFGSFLSTRDGTLRASEPLHCCDIEARRRNYCTVAIGDDVGHAAVERDNWLNAGSWVDDLDLTGDRGKPLVPVTTDRARLRLAFQRTMNDRADVADLWKPNGRTVQPPDFGMWLAQTKHVSHLVFPPRHSGEAPKTALPCLVQFHEELGAYIARDVGKPGQFGAKIGKLPMLIEQRRIPLVSAGQANEALLVREVPQEPQRRLPRDETRLLRWRRIDAVSEALVNKHDDAYNRDAAQRKRFLCIARDRQRVIEDL